MGASRKARFAHRLTKAGTFESICLQCYRTIGWSEFESGLERPEELHECLLEDLIRLYGEAGPETVNGKRHKKQLA